MKAALFYVVFVAIAPASPILLTGQPAVTLQSGDAVEFQFGAWNYEDYAGQLYPGRISFMLTTAPAGVAAPAFNASLASADGAESLEFAGTVNFRSGYMKATNYTGPVSVLAASMAISPEEAAALFGPDAHRAALLVLRNLGGAVTLGLPNYSVDQMLSVSLGGTSVSVGAPRGAAYLSPAGTIQMSLDGPPHAPEPGTVALVLPALAAACLWRLRRSSKRP
jgi:hypothetical protein